jgi:hypothetical protein
MVVLGGRSGQIVFYKKCAAEDQKQFALFDKI